MSHIKTEIQRLDELAQKFHPQFQELCASAVELTDEEQAILSDVLNRALANPSICYDDWSYMAQVREKERQAKVEAGGS